MTFDKNWTLLSVLAASLICSNISFADDELVTQGLAEAQALFDQRSVTNPQPIENALAKLKQLEDKADDSDLNYDVLILESRANYWKGEHVNGNEEKKRIFKEGQDKADAAIQINDGYADGYYYAGINLARWGEANGVLTSLSRKGELIKYMNNTLNHMTRGDTQQPGESIDGYGPDRVFGRMYFKLPDLFGGSHTESLKYLKKAFDNAKNLPLNVVYYAETLYAGNQSEKALAKSILDELIRQLKNDPVAYNSKRVPENLDELELARKLRAEMN